MMYDESDALSDIMEISPALTTSERKTEYLKILNRLVEASEQIGYERGYDMARFMFEE